jgi:glycosyltransferase involved in cell wall biosynthesis
MILIFISSAQYPNGGAATNRHLAYSKGLTELGHDVEFILLEKQQWEGNELQINKIKFTCINVVEKNNLSKLKKAILHLKNINEVINLLNERNKEKNISALILLDTRISILLPLIWRGKKLGLKIFHERTEYPFVVSGKTFFQKINLNIYLRFVVKRFDGLFVINHALKKYFSALTNSKIIIVNMIVDPSRFDQLTDKSDNSKTIITYCGTLDNDKDGVPILIKSFALTADKFTSATLRIIGSLSNNITKQRMKSLVHALEIEDKVEFTGSIDREKMPMLLKNSDILALARPNNKQAEGGFPTKLGEYLATGKPVVVTDVGEIGLFLKDQVNAYIAEPDSPEKFSEKLCEALADENKHRIGLEGQKLVYNEFNYLIQAKRLEELFIPENLNLN